MKYNLVFFLYILQNQVCIWQIDCILLLENHCKPSSSGQGCLLSYKDLRKTNNGKNKIHIQQID
jgi:hypothetical protein